MFMSIIDSVLNEASIKPFVDSFNAFTASLGVVFSVLIIVLSLLVGLFGRRLADPIRFLLLFAVGFVASVYWLAPMLAEFVPDVPAYAIGLSVGAFAAVMSRMIYNLVYVGCIGFDTYNICFNAILFAELTASVQGNLPVCLGIACGVTILALLVRKYLEMIITAAAGGIGVAFFANQIFGFTANFGGMDPTTAVLLVGAVIALPFFLFQYRNRVIF